MKTQQTTGTQVPETGGTNPVFAAALAELERGRQPVPLVPCSKAARHRAWLTARIEPSTVAEYFDPGDNIGLLTGPASGGVVCVDLDSETAVRLARLVLPATALLGGGPSKPNSHPFYLCDPIPKSRRFVASKTGEPHV